MRSRSTSDTGEQAPRRRPSRCRWSTPPAPGTSSARAWSPATLAGWPLAERLRFANLAAALSVQRPGGAPAAPGWPEIAAWWRAQQPFADRETLAQYGFLDELVPVHAPPEATVAHGPDLTDR